MRRNEIERRLKGFRCFSRFDKLALFLGFVLFALIYDAVVSVNRP